MLIALRAEGFIITFHLLSASGIYSSSRGQRRLADEILGRADARPMAAAADYFAAADDDADYAAANTACGRLHVPRGAHAQSGCSTFDFAEALDSTDA